MPGQHGHFRLEGGGSGRVVDAQKVADFSHLASPGRNSGGVEKARGREGEEQRDEDEGWTGIGGPHSRGIRNGRVFKNTTSAAEAAGGAAGRGG